MNMNRIADRILEKQFDGARIFAARTGVKDLVYIEGSVHGGWNMLPRRQGELSVLAAELLDAGTKGKSKDQIRESLASRGASLSFSSGDERTYFRGSCLPEDISRLISVLVECLGEASFPLGEVKTAKNRIHGELVEERNDTRVQAAIALSRLMYDPKHHNYEETTNERIADLKKTERPGLIAFKKMLGYGGLVLAIVGDIDAEAALILAEKAFKKLPGGTKEAPSKTPNTRAQEGQITLVPITDKANIDVFIGASIPLTYNDPLYLPFILLTEMLGGRGFTSHLMATVRERDGLTYGVNSRPTGFTGGADGAFQVWATFSPAKYDESVAVLRKEIDFFFKNGITEMALAARKEEMTGLYAVGLSTSRGLAATLHQIGRRHRDLSYIDDYLTLLQAVTLDELHKAASLIPLKNLSLAAAGTFTG
ncbi:MAG: Zinc protease [Parcubacteria group bacterium]|nr:Zinc protease [Parcubacteria group bacterium]